VSVAAAAAGIAEAQVTNVITDPGAAGLKWHKAPCRFCGTGCGVTVAVKGNRVVATLGDPQAEVNRGLNCVKGYFLSKIMYGEDRLQKPMLRMKNGKFDKNGEFAPVTWDQAFDVMAEKCKAALKAKGPSAVGMFGSGQWTIWEGYAANKLFKAGFRFQQHRSQRAPLHGLGGRGVHAALRHRRADGLLRRHRGRRRLRAVGLEHGGDAPHPVDARDRPAPVESAGEGRRCCRCSSTAATTSPTCRSSSGRRPTSRSSTTSPTTSSRRTA
jgi:hypothetical protein